MTKDQWIGLAIVTGLIYVWGVANRGWTSPLDVLRYLSGLDPSGQENCSSDDEDMSYEDDDDLSDPGDDEDEDDGQPRARRLVRPLSAPQPLDELLAERGIVDDLDDVDLDGIPVPADTSAGGRRRWLRARMRPGDEISATRTSTEVDRLAAKLFGVDDRTIRRDRAHIRRAK